MKVEAMGVERAQKYEKVEIDRKVEVDKKVSTTFDAETKEKVEATDKNIQEALDKINKHLEVANTKIKFKIHDSKHSLNDKVSIKVVDEESQKVIAEIPSEEAIELSEKMQQIIGVLFDVSK